MVGDGILKEVTVYNDSLPGPPIVVYEGQQVSCILYLQKLREVHLFTRGIYFWPYSFIQNLLTSGIGGVNILSIDSLGFMVVYTIKKYL